MKGRGLIWALAAAAIVAVFALAAWRGGLILPAPGAAAVADGPAIGGPFHLTDQTGARVDERLLRGKWSLVFFGYTFCPDVCPTTLTMLGQTVAKLGSQAKDLQVVFITIDPARDTPAQLKDYITNPAFPKPMVGLTGSAADIAAVARAYHVYYKQQGTGPGYSMDHTAVIYLMDTQGRFVKPISPGPPSDVARQISEAEG